MHPAQGSEQLYRAHIAGPPGSGWGDVAGMRAGDEGRMGQDRARMGARASCIEGRGGFTSQALRLTQG